MFLALKITLIKRSKMKKVKSSNKQRDLKNETKVRQASLIERITGRIRGNS